MENLAKSAGRNLQAVRKTKPLVHNITNYVVMNFTANVLLAMGASPVMAHAVQEVEEMVSFAKALVLNIGTLSEKWVDSMIKAGEKASDLGTPIILDPVGSGATLYRTETAKHIIQQTRVSVIRGNASEILSFRDKDSKTKGVDTIHSVEDAAQNVAVLASELNSVIAITGPVDLVTNGKQMVRVSNGHPLMGSVTGTGCGATATVGAFLAVDDDPVRATATALAFFGLAGEVAGKNTSGPGSFQIAMMDALYQITPERLEKECKFQIEL